MAHDPPNDQPTDRPYGPPDPRLCLMMFLEFFIWGAWYVTIGNYMGEIGLGDSIGHAYTVGPIAAIISPFFLGMVADRFFPTQKVLAVLHLVGGAALLAAPAVAMYSVHAAAGRPPLAPGQTPPFINPAHLPFLLVLLVHMLCYMPTLGLTNTICFHHMRAPERQFPVVRVFGTVGWIAAGWVLGIAATRLLPAGTNTADPVAVNAATAALPHFFYLAGGAGILLGLFSLALPHTPPPAAGRKATVRDVLGLDSLSLLRQPSFFVFILCSFLICIPLAAYYAFAPVFVGASGFSPDQVPIKMSYGQMSEIVFMLLMPLFFARLGVKWMLAVGMLAWVVRYGLFAAAAPAPGAAPDPSLMWMVVLGIMLHGICYDFFFVTGFIYVDRKAPKELRGQAQGFLVLVTQGLGLGLGAQLFGRLVGHYTSYPATIPPGVARESVKMVDWQHIWMAPAAAAAVILLLFVAAFRDDTRAAPTPPVGSAP